MRTYIFSPREKEALKKYLDGTEKNTLLLRVLLSRIRNADLLEEDVVLFLKVRKKLKEGG